MTDSHQPAAPSGASAPVLAPNLEAQLTCSICTDLLHQPLTLLDCLHTFCGACLKEWFRFQALRVESAPGPPPPPGTAVFTCPSCRESVRDTRHDARVFSLLDMFLALNPGCGKSAAEKEEMDARYSRGEQVMPRVERIEGRSEEERRLDEEERRVIEEVRAVSLREATERAAGLGGGGGGRGRGSREGSRVRGERDGGGGRSRTRRRSQSRPGDEQHDRAGPRQVEHQSSLRNLISSDGMDARDIEREIEEFARQIQEEGLLEGLDLDNLDLENNDELSRKITEAYRRRQRERRRDGGRRSNASAHSHRSDVSARPRSRTGEASSRPTSRHTPRSRAPSASDTEDRGRYPPSTSAHLEVQEVLRRRRTSSGSRSATLPVVSTTAEVRVGGHSQTDLTSRSGTAESHVRRPSMGVDVRSSSSPTTATAPVAARGDSPANRAISFSARAAAGLGTAQSQPEARSSSTSSRQRSDRPVALDIRPESPTLGSVSAPTSPALVSPPLASPRRHQLPRYKEPLIKCNTCAREHIEYELHYNCSVCHNGDWNICLDCWRRRKGCLHWFGFGHVAWARWEKQNRAGPPIPPPHMLTANRYLAPKPNPGGADGRRVLTTENPLDRLQSGTFCCGCSAWTNECYWRCSACNDGEWGFCSDCVNQARCCSHPLLALAYRPPSPSAPHAGANAATSPPGAWTTMPIGNFHPLSPNPCCSHCRELIPQSSSIISTSSNNNDQCQYQHYHCSTCPSSLPQPDSSLPGGYNLCPGCYTSLVSGGSISPENGPSGWRRCPQGHRMVVVGFVPDDSSINSNSNNNGNNSDSRRAGNGTSYLRRKVVRDLVGGRRLRFNESKPPPPASHRQPQQSQGRDGAQVQTCWWLEEGTGQKLERLYSRDVGVSTAGMGGEAGPRFTKAFPPDGGAGHRAVAGWGWVPAEGVEDELLFPKGAEVLEVEDINGEWFHGFFMGAGGLFPAPYVRLVGPP
ncbi:hypothetical protein N658DRAFT_461874 [Parathielavia hyrcaniae]|uniref:RING-type domain-containing protein n=1 Tax=Parathielavia hyrcaniae TaxID=113614 RepID=A0AAN6QER7_9PEZI|nr:hypothetical protein N658DRAFT_461874 [Parathielavia hyrcaniae]